MQEVVEPCATGSSAKSLQKSTTNDKKVGCSNDEKGWDHPEFGGCEVPTPEKKPTKQVSVVYLQLNMEDYEHKLQDKVLQQQILTEKELEAYEKAPEDPGDEDPSLMEEWEKKLRARQMETILAEPLEEEWEKKLRLKESEQVLEEQRDTVSEFDLAKFEDSSRDGGYSTTKRANPGDCNLMEEWETRVQQAAASQCDTGP
jgi:hypothetical protein